MFLNFGPNSPYRGSLSELYKKGTCDTSIYPIAGKWRNFLLRRFVECHPSGAGCVQNDSNVDCDNVIRNIPLVALLAGKGVLETLQQSVLQLQDNDMVMAIVMATSRIIERYILNASCLSGEGGAEDVHPIERVVQDLRHPDRVCADSLDTAMISHLNAVLGSRELSLEDASAKFGVS